MISLHRTKRTVARQVTTPHGSERPFCRQGRLYQPARSADTRICKMTSILTNSSAMVALQTLKSINGNLSDTQNQISTGKAISSAKDNAAVWSISKVMETDVSTIDSITSSLNLGQSTVSVARQAAESVVSKLQSMQEIAVNASSDNVDHSTLTEQMGQLAESIKSVIGSAQFNGLNLLDGSSSGMSMLSSFSRSGNTITTSSLTVEAKDLLNGAYVAKSASPGTTGASATGDTFAMTLDATTGTGDITFDTSTLAAGDTVSLTISGQKVSYTLSAEDMASTSPSALVATGLKSAIESLGISGLTVNYDDTSADTLSLSNTGGTALSVTGQYANAGSTDLATLDVSTSTAAAASVEKLSALISQATAVASYYGSTETQLSDQADFMSTLSDAMTTGIGSLVDADMEEASARLTALQTQQQLGIQALSIANQQPQTILSLFK